MAALAALALASSARAASFYWTGDDNAFWNTIAGPGGTNWSSSGDSNQGTAGFPGSGDDVFFNLFGAGNLSTQLGADFSIRSLTFTPDATSDVTIGGANTLTIGTGGITDNGAAAVVMSGNVALGASQTWANNTVNPFTVSGAISGGGGNNLTIGGSGAFTLTGANTYSGFTALFTGTLNVSGASGAIASSSGISLGAGTVLNLDSTAANHASQNRIGDSTTITSSGGFINLLGNAAVNTTETVGTLAVASGATYVTVTLPGGVQTATLTLGGASPSLSHAIGGTVTFSSTGTVMAPNVTLVNPSNPIIGGWATIGTVNDLFFNAFDWATVDGSNQVVPLATYQPLTSAPLSTDNAQGSAATDTVILNAGTNTVNTLSFNGSNYGMQFTNNTDVIVIGAGGIFSTNATGNGNYDNKAATPNMTFVGSPDSGTANVGGTVAYNGRITSGFFPTATTSELDVFTTANGNLRLYSVIQDPDATHRLTLVKSGPGLLDLSGGNTQNNKTANTFTGKVIINEGILLINIATNLGNPAAGQADTVIFNGGELRTFAGLNTVAGNGWTVGTRGGIFSYTGGGTTNIQNKITGVGGFTFYSRAFGGGTNEIINIANAAQNNDYQGPTNLWISRDNGGGQFGRLAFTQNNQIPATSAVTLSVVDDTPVHNQINNANNAGNPASLDFTGRTDHFGSLAGNLNIRGFSGALTIGANNLSTVYTGSIYGSATQVNQADTAIQSGTGSLTKVGTGTQTLSGTNNRYTGATAINGGTLLIGAGTGPTSTAMLIGSPVTVGNGALVGALGGNGTITGTVTVTSTGHLAPAMSTSTTNTLTIGNNLTINAGATLDYNFGAAGTPGTSDFINLTGAGNILLNAGTDVLNITQLPGFGVGTYKLLTNSGGGGLADNATFTINGKPNFNYAVLKPGDPIDSAAGGGVVPAKQLWLQVLPGNPFITWIGGVNGNWDVNTTANWAGDNTVFTTGANVIFDDLGAGRPNVTVAAGGVSASSMVFNNATVNYTIGGAAITVTAGAGVTKGEAGNVTMNANLTTPITAINSGTLTVGSGATYASTSKVDVNGGTLAVNGTLNTPLLNVKNDTLLNVAASGALGGSTALNVVGTGTATFNNASQTLGGLSGTGVVNLNGTALTFNGTGSFGGTLAGTGGSLSVTGGSLTLSNGANSYTGGTTVSGGTLLVTNASGSATGAGLVTVQAAGTLGGTGRIGGNLTLSGHLAPGGGAIGTINIGGGVTINAGGVLDYDFAAPGNNDTAAIGGALSLAGAETLNINGLAGFSPGSYALATAAGGVTNNATFTINASGPGASPTFVYSVLTQGDQLLLNVDALTLTWKGTVDNNWDFTTANWQGAVTVFANGFRARFDDTGTNTTLNIGAPVAPFGALFANSAAVPYQMFGAAIGGGGPLVVNGGGMVTLNNANTYTGGTVISNGSTLSVSADNLGDPAGAVTIDGATLQFTGTATLPATRAVTLGSSNATINITFTASGSLDDQNTTGVKYTGAITGPGSLTVTGGAGVNDPVTAPYLLVLNGQANSYTGNTLIDNATVANDAGVTGGNHLPATTVLTLVNNGVYSIYGNANGFTLQTLAGLVGDSTGLIGTENNTTPTIFTINTATGTSYTFGGRIADVNVLGRGQILVGGAPVSIVKDGAGTQILTGDNPYAGTTTINDGILQIGDGGSSGSLGTGAVIDNALLVFNRGDNLIVPNAISGTGTVTNDGDTSNVLTLSGAQDYAILNADSGTTNVTGSFTAGIATVNVEATLNFGADETIAALNIGVDGVVTLGVIAPAPLAPADGNDAQLGDSSPLASDSDMSQSGAPVVPEPGSMSLLLLGMLSVFGRRQHRAR